jgi:hypothetical protein
MPRGVFFHVSALKDPVAMNIVPDLKSERRKLVRAVFERSHWSARQVSPLKYTLLRGAVVEHK